MEKISLETVEWSSMPHIDDVGKLSDEDYDVLKEVGDVLRKHGREKKFGLCLLHKHFELSQNERMFEVTDYENKTLITKAVSVDECEMSNAVETAWRFSGGLDTVTVCERVCDYFLGHKSVHKRVGR